MVIDINLDDGLLDGLAAMQKFCKIAVTEPDVSKVGWYSVAQTLSINILLCTGTNYTRYLVATILPLLRIWIRG